MDLVNAAQQQPGPEGTDMDADDEISDIEPQNPDISAPSSSSGHQELYIDKSGAHVPITPEQGDTI